MADEPMASSMSKWQKQSWEELAEGADTGLRGSGGVVEANHRLTEAIANFQRSSDRYSGRMLWLTIVLTILTAVQVVALLPAFRLWPASMTRLNVGLIIFVTVLSACAVLVWFLWRARKLEVPHKLSVGDLGGVLAAVLAAAGLAASLAAFYEPRAKLDLSLRSTRRAARFSNSAGLICPSVEWRRRWL